MGFLHAIVLGLVQGLTEFLPVSSSGHLVLLQRIFGISEPGMFFGVMLHVGTLLAVFVVLWRDIWVILRKPIQPLTGFLIIGTVPAVIGALTFKGQIELAFETGRFLGISFLITSALLCTAELLPGRTSNSLKKTEEMTWADALVVGIMQAIAMIPGVSRSGATITGALSRKLNRDLAARFSFLLSIPAIMGALVLQLAEVFSVAGAAEITSVGLVPLIAGTVTAAITGFFAVRFMLKIIREKTLFGFAIYTAALGILVLADQLWTNFVF